jgi:hypothetical protein
MPRSEIDVEAEIGALAGLDLSTLQRRWREFYGAEPPVHMSLELMRRAIAYRIQEDAFGSLSVSMKAKLGKGKPGADGRASRVLRDQSVKPGTKFLREWNGRIIDVVAMANGRYLYEGEAYRSLSAIARRITGTRWSGPAFFGIGARTGSSHG